jgi:hypothetical protein
MTALFANAGLLNPFRYPAYSFILFSHKLMRWLAPLPLAGCFVSAFLLRAEPLYGVAFFVQSALYTLGLAGLAFPDAARRSLILRLPSYFILVNAAAVKAFAQWLSGRRQEIWEPTQRPP